jgi:tRNA-(ms[2]io[6]A)-hydroxylase
VSDWQRILLAPTPSAWVELATTRWRELLIDHAACEKKAASTALALMFAYPQDRALGRSLSRLAREELRHFEQVQSLMDEVGVGFERQKPGRYASGLRAALRTAEPGRKLDLLLISALIEARSCERFALLAPRLPPPLAGFYAQLQRAEARHCLQYLDFAAREPELEPGECNRRLQALACQEAELIRRPDGAFRFHSGTPI